MRIFKRKLYDKLLDWKNNRKGRTAVLIEGARRVANPRWQDYLLRTSTNRMR